MKSRKLDFIKCECGKNVSLRALLRHLNSDIPNHTDVFVAKCTKYIEWQRIDKFAWKISDGENGIGMSNWCALVLNNEIDIKELSFESPRPKGQNPPKKYKEMSENRKGKGNPSVKDKPIYDIIKMKSFAIEEFKKLETDYSKFKKLESILRNNFPDYGFSFVEMFNNNDSKRGHNRANSILSYLIDRPIEWIIKEKALDRGKLISIGQLKSPNLSKMQNAGKETLRKFGRTTLPHKVLFNMVLSLDENAIKEKQIDYEKTWKSYDIFSPSLNILIEMHGRLWHTDKHIEKPSLTNILTHNLKNDKIKEKLAKDLGYKLIVFWDDECYMWAKQLKDTYGKEPKSYEQALREEIDKKEKH